MTQPQQARQAGKRTFAPGAREAKNAKIAEAARTNWAIRKAKRDNHLMLSRLEAQRVHGKDRALEVQIANVQEQRFALFDLL